MSRHLTAPSFISPYPRISILPFPSLPARRTDADDGPQQTRLRPHVAGDHPVVQGAPARRLPHVLVQDAVLLRGEPVPERACARGVVPQLGRAR